MIEYATLGEAMDANPHMYSSAPKPDRLLKEELSAQQYRLLKSGTHQCGCGASMNSERDYSHKCGDMCYMCS